MEHEKICKNIDRELEEYSDKKELSMGDYQKLQMLTEIKKNFLRIKKLESEGEYEESESHRGGSYAGDRSYGYDHSRYDHGYSERRMRDSRGRYKSSRDGAGYEGGSSAHFDEAEDMIEELKELMHSCDGKGKERIRKWIKELEEA
jgi:hypothetical protein